MGLKESLSKTPRAKGCAGLAVPTWRSPKPKLGSGVKSRHPRTCSRVVDCVAGGGQYHGLRVGDEGPAPELRSVRPLSALAVLAVAVQSTTARPSARMPPETIVLALVVIV